MFGFGWCGGMGVGGWLLMIGFWGGFLALVVWVVSRVFPSTRPQRPDPADLLDRRFAAGEIDAETYRQARSEMAGQTSHLSAQRAEG